MASNRALFPSANDEDTFSKDTSSEDRNWLKNDSFTTSLVTTETKRSEVKSENRIKKPNQEKSSFVVTSSALNDPEKQGYHIDEKSDPTNLSYESLYSGDVASYKRRFECVGLSDNQSIIWNDRRSKMKQKPKKSKQSRYFHTGAVTQSDKEVMIPSVAVSISAQPSEFISLRTSEDVQIVEDESLTAQKYVTQCVGEYNRRLLHEPHNISLWMEFISAQDHMLEWAGQSGERVGRKHRAILERKVAIFERAIESNPRSVELLVGHMMLVEEVWEPGKVVQRWKDLVFHHPNKPRLWLGYIMFCQSQFSSFTSSSLVSLYCKSITTLVSIEKGVLKSHLPEPDTMSSVLQLFFYYCNFLRQVGHTEKAVASYQALIEFNLCTPAQFSDIVSSSEQMQFFETFWDSGVARFGEQGAQGWSNWMNKSGSCLGLIEGKSTVEPVAEEEDHLESTLVSGSDDLHKAWLVLEDYRRTHQVLPWRPDVSRGETDEDCADPDRVVLFDDVSPILFQISELSLQLKLVLSFLHFLGAPSPSSVTTLSQHHSTLVESPLEISNHISNTLDGLLFGLPSFEQSLGVGSNDTNLYSLSSLSEIGEFLTSQLLDMTHLPVIIRNEQVCNFIHNVFNQSISLFSSDVASQTTIAQLWIAFSLSQLTGEELSKRSKAKIKAVQKLIKSLLRLEANRNNLTLWRCCALIEHLIGNYSETVRIFENVLTQHASPLLFLSLFECTMNLQTSLCSTSPPVNTDLALHVLVCMCEGKYILMSGAPTPSNLLRARTSIDRIISVNETKLPNTETVCIVLGHAYFEYLTRGLDEACKVLNTWIQAITSRMATGEWNKADVLPFLKLVYSKQAHLIVHHSKTNPVPPNLLRKVLEAALDLFPSDSFFLTLFVASEEQSFISGRLRRFFNNQTFKTDTPTLWLYSVTAELSRYHRLLSANVEISEESSLGIVHRIMATLRRAVASENGQHCPLLWRLYMALMVHTNPAQIKPIFYQAIHSCPWAKILYYDAVMYLPEEMDRFMELLEEKEIRLKAPLEEIKLLQKL